MERDVKEFLYACIHCIVSRSGDRTPQPISAALRAEEPNIVFYANYLYTGLSDNNNLKYILNRDDLSAYACVHPCGSGDSEFPTNEVAE